MTFGKIGARKMMNTAWINPYVKDGLVAMWDGIWNVGGGQTHDNSSKIWWDCIGGKPIILMSGKSVFGNLGVVQSAMSVFSDQMVGSVFGDADSYGWRFAEFVFSLGSVSSNTPVVLMVGRRGIFLNISGQDVGVTMESNATWHSSTAFTADQPLCFSVDYNSSGTSEKGSAVWFKASSIPHTGVSDGWGGVNLSPYTAGTFYSSTYSFVGTYHAIRLYNRALTQTEIDSNYATDVQRFNLTGGA